VQFQIDQYITYGRNANATDGSNSFEITSYDFAGMIESKEFKDAYNTILRLQANTHQLQKTQLTYARKVMELLN
ncbi:MAG: hypothetical protein AB8B80_14280, partial [Marinicellaceae bacterium]